MHPKRLPCLAMLLWVCASHAQTSDPIFRSGFETIGALTANWQANLDVHNALRASVSPAASPALPAMQWNTTVAAAAQSYADQCTFEHSASGYGENLYATTGHYSDEQAAARLWAAEAPNYTYANNSCAAGQICGHYTQMVWRSSTQLGCGIRECSSGSPWGDGTWTIVVCQYNAPGNYNGQRPY